MASTETKLFKSYVKRVKFGRRTQLKFRSARKVDHQAGVPACQMEPAVLRDGCVEFTVCTPEMTDAHEIQIEQSFDPDSAFNYRVTIFEFGEQVFQKDYHMFEAWDFNLASFKAKILQGLNLQQTNLNCNRSPAVLRYSNRHLLYYFDSLSEGKKLEQFTPNDVRRAYQERMAKDFVRNCLGDKLETWHSPDFGSKLSKYLITEQISCAKFQMQNVRKLLFMSQDSEKEVSYSHYCALFLTEDLWIWTHFVEPLINHRLITTDLQTKLKMFQFKKAYGALHNFLDEHQKNSTYNITTLESHLQQIFSQDFIKSYLDQIRSITPPEVGLLFSHNRGWVEMALDEAKNEDQVYSQIEPDIRKNGLWWRVRSQNKKAIHKALFYNITEDLTRLIENRYRMVGLNSRTLFTKHFASRGEFVQLLDNYVLIYPVSHNNLQQDRSVVSWFPKSNPTDVKNVLQDGAFPPNSSCIAVHQTRVRFVLQNLDLLTLDMYSFDEPMLESQGIRRIHSMPITLDSGANCSKYYLFANHHSAFLVETVYSQGSPTKTRITEVTATSCSTTDATLCEGLSKELTPGTLVEKARVDRKHIVFAVQDLTRDVAPPNYKLLLLNFSLKLKSVAVLPLKESLLETVMRQYRTFSLVVSITKQFKYGQSPKRQVNS